MASAPLDCGNRWSKVWGVIGYLVCGSHLTSRKIRTSPKSRVWSHGAIHRALPPHPGPLVCVSYFQQVGLVCPLGRGASAILKLQMKDLQVNDMLEKTLENLTEGENIEGLSFL